MSLEFWCVGRLEFLQNSSLELIDKINTKFASLEIRIFLFFGVLIIRVFGNSNLELKNFGALINCIYNLQSTIYNLQSTIYNLQSTIYILQSTISNLGSWHFEVRGICIFKNSNLRSTKYSMSSNLNSFKRKNYLITYKLEQTSLPCPNLSNSLNIHIYIDDQNSKSKIHDESNDRRRHTKSRDFQTHP